MSADEATAQSPPVADDNEVKGNPTKESSEKPKSASKKAAPSSSKGTAKPRSSVAGGGAKKASGDKNAGENKKFEVGDIVLARLKGYPPWPARIADPDAIPEKVSAQRPSKNPSIYCVNYFPAGDFSWLHTKEISALSPSAIDTFLAGGHRKASGSLKEAYETARDPTEWLAGQTESLRQQEEEDRAAEEDEDQLEDEEAASGGKRKRAGSDKKSAPKKKAKSAKKAEEPAAKRSKTTKKSAAPASAPENQPPADDDPLANDPECVKVKDWRHKLQRAFLSKSLPSAEEMSSYDETFKTIEAYKGMTIEALQYSKIGKVMKKIATLEGIPRNDELKITDRASKLMTEWHDFIANSGSANGEGSKSGTKADAPAATEEADDKKDDAADKEDEGKTDAPAAEEKKEDAAEANGNGDAKEDEKMDVEA